MFYQHNIDYVSACPVTIHSLLHVADGIEAADPVWVYWAFMMEWYCGFLKCSGVWNCKNPHKSLNQQVLDVACLYVLKLKYGLVDVLPPKKPHQGVSELFPKCKFTTNGY